MLTKRFFLDRAKQSDLLIYIHLMTFKLRSHLTFEATSRSDIESRTFREEIACTVWYDNREFSW